MASRVQPVAVQAAEQVDPSEPNALRDALSSAAAATFFGARPAMAAKVNALLRAVRPGPDAEVHATTILDALEKDAFGAMEDDKGVVTRVEAVDALLRLGYPWALQVHPRDLDYFRGARRAPRRRLLMVVLGAILAAAAAGAALVAVTSRDAPRVEAPAVVGRPRHVALERPALAPRELVVGDSVTTSRATAVRDSAGALVAEIAVRTESQHSDAPQLEVKTLGLYDESTETLVQSFPAEGVRADVPTGARLLTLSIPMPSELTRESARYFFVLDASVNGMPVRSLRTEAIGPDDALSAPTFSLDEPATLVRPLPVDVTSEGPAKLVVSVDASGAVTQVVPLDRWSPRIRRLVLAVEGAEFKPAQLGQRPVGSTFVLEVPQTSR